MNNHDEPLGPIRGVIAAIGALFIAGLIRVFGRTVRESSATWLSGPVGSEYIGDTPYEELAAREHLELVRRASSGGLIPDFRALNGPGFPVEQLRPEVRHFYEHTAAYRMDVWSETFFPGNIGLWLLVTTISRKVDQLNFLLHAHAAAKGIEGQHAARRVSGLRRQRTGVAMRSSGAVSRHANIASALPD